MTNPPFLRLPTPVIIWSAVNIAIFFILLLLPAGGGAWLREFLVQQFIFVPVRDLAFLNGGGFSIPYQLITYGFLHHDMPHLFFNLTMGLVFSKMIYEPLGGVQRWSVILLAGLLGGAALHTISSGGLSATIGILGASAGVAGWLGAALFLALNRITMPPPFSDHNRALSFIMFFIVLNFLLATITNSFANTRISNAGHLGGLIGGFLAAWATMLGRLNRY